MNAVTVIKYAILKILWGFGCFRKPAVNGNGREKM